MSMRLPGVPSCGRNRPRSAGGFSLIEVLVALVITGLALTEEKIAAAGVTEPLRTGRSGGLFATRFQWQLSVEPYRDESSAGFDRPLVELQLYRVAVTVAWRDGHRQRALALDTLRLGVPPP